MAAASWPGSGRSWNWRGIPSHDTGQCAFVLIDPDAFGAGFTAWVGALAAGFEREGVAIDGKTVRRSFDHGREQSPLHVVSAWAELVKVPLARRVGYPAEGGEPGLVLGQRCGDGTSNEIAAVPEPLDQPALRNSIVTLDAMGGAGQEGSVGEADGRPAENGLPG